jgi:hypothetical protein
LTTWRVILMISRYNKDISVHHRMVCYKHLIFWRERITYTASGSETSEADCSDMTNFIL